MKKKWKQTFLLSPLAGSGVILLRDEKPDPD